MPATTTKYSFQSATQYVHNPVESSPTDEGDLVRTRVLLLGLRRSGKTSIQQVLFNDLSPKQSFFLETTTKITKHHFDSIIPLEIWDCPGSITVEALGAPLASFASIIFVIDIQDSYHQPIAKLIEFALGAYQVNPAIKLEVFVHKAEALTEDFRIENFRHIQSRVLDELADLPPLNVTIPSSSPPQTREIVPEQIPLNFYLTSVYDHSLQESFSRVLQRLLDDTCLPYLEDLLNSFCANSHSSKAFLFDTRARIFLATDHSPVDSIRHNLCCDYVLMLNSFGGLYQSVLTSPTQHPRRLGRLENMSQPSSQVASLSSTPTTSNLSAHGQLPNSPPRPSVSAFHSPTKATTALSPQLLHSPLPGTSSAPIPPSNPSSAASSRPDSATPAEPPAPKTMFYPSSATSLAPDTTLIYHVITPDLALLALLPTAVWESRRGLVEYNVVFFREGVQEIYAVERDTRRRQRPPPVARKK